MLNSMSRERTAEEIKAEAGKLLALKPNVPRLNAFGQNNHNAIDAQIKTLTERLDEDAIDDLYDDMEMDSYDRDSAYEAVEWMSGEEPMPPSEGWEPTVKKEL
jgi:hypothetical protein